MMPGFPVRFHAAAIASLALAFASALTIAFDD